MTDAPDRRRPLKIGVQLPEVERNVRWSELRDMARVAEDVGFDSLWVGDHLLFRFADRPPRGPWEAWSVLAGLAAVTSRVELGPLVAAVTFHNPAVIAKKAATIDEISNGRLILGLGAGWGQDEHAAYGLPADHRVGRFREAFAIIVSLLRTGHADVDGRFYQVRDCDLVPRGPRSAGPPIMVGTVGPQLLRASAADMDGWNGWYDRYGNTPGGFAALSATVDEAARAVRRDPREIERTAAVLVQLPGGRGRVQGERVREEAPALRGTPEALAAGLAAFADVGASHLQLVLDPITTASIEALAPVLEILDRG